ncbi:cytochrome c biogenesis protein CcsA [Rapidithrix thailandica]|uniref:Cytochrome c biogenesis protein CcsA n=1 Tax=Rapidithrix thailandica TaxID=413964 RepID=A0AAW9S1I2_9BACT
MRTIWSLIVSGKTTLVLFFLYALAMGTATFVENDFGTPAARNLVYEAWWFEWIMLLLGVNFIGNIFKYKLLQRKKLPILLFHLAFILVLAGAWVTRYLGFEGILRIRENQANNRMITEKFYLSGMIETPGWQQAFEFQEKLGLFDHDFHQEISMGDKTIALEVVQFIPQAEPQIIPDTQGSALLQLVVADSSGRKDHFLQKGQQVHTKHLTFQFGPQTKNTISLVETDSGFYMCHPVPLQFMHMDTQEAGILPGGSYSKLKLRTLYQHHNLRFTIPAIHANSSLKYVTCQDKEKAKQLDDLTIVKVSFNGETQQANLWSAQGFISRPEQIQVGGADCVLSYGPKVHELPFSLYLRDFQLERYPGSQSPSSYASEVTVMDAGQETPTRIFMNNVLDYKGYRFFQASYDTDEKGTVLSVNHDWWGTQITYMGYFLMGLGMFLTLFGKGSRFLQLNKQLNSLKKRSVPVAVFLTLLVALPYSSRANEVDSLESFNEEDITHWLSLQYIAPNHADNFGALLVQDLDGRIKPINSLASEFLRKLMRKTHYTFQVKEETYTYSADQVFLAINAEPTAWSFIPLIKIDPKKGKEIQKIVPVNSKSLAAFRDFFDEKGNYLLFEQVEKANLKKPAERSELDNELINVDERFNILYHTLSGKYLKIFPLPNDPSHTWYPGQQDASVFKGEDSVFVKNILPIYYQSIQQARTDKQWEKPEEYLDYIKTYQNKMGEAVLPAEEQVKAELLYNRLDLFSFLFKVCWILGPIMLVLAIVRVFAVKRTWVKASWWFMLALSMAVFLLHTFNLLLRWYAGGHAPWSNGYEMTLLVSWSLLLFGWVFSKKSDFTLPLSVLFSGTLLFVAWLDWLNPEITNLVPVLKSYWLKIHVAIIVGSYAPLALSALLGTLSLFFMIFKNENNQKALSKSITELTCINEMSMTIGLFLLSVGTFLGGVWANESWGRYWAWDPKETWALISIIVYAFVLHMRFVPGMKGHYAFNLAGLLAFASILMTSFGVNYYLAGLHSYAKGDPVPVPDFVYWTIAFVALLAVVSYIQYRKFKKLQKSNKGKETEEKVLA